MELYSKDFEYELSSVANHQRLLNFQCRAMDNGRAKGQAREVVTQLAFLSNNRIPTALPVVKDLFDG
jgi:hypothetical protein